MILGTLIWGAPAWLWPAVAFAVVLAALLAWGYRRAPISPGLRIFAAALKAIGITALLFCLLEPLISSLRPRPGANLFVVLADDSQSLKIRDPGATQSRGETLRELLADDAPWYTRLGQDFEVRRYAFAERLRSLNEPGDLTGEGTGSSLVSALRTVRQRFGGRNLAGVILLTDGNATDLPDEAVDWSDFAAVYPVALGSNAPMKDVSIRQVSVSQTNFELTPVEIRAEIGVDGYDAASVAVELLDADGKQLQQQTLDPADAAGRRVVRFRLRPEEPGVSFYQLRAATEEDVDRLDAPEKSSEATLANNGRLVVVQRPKGPYRVLYVSGRPNWEFKFLRRATESDREVELVGLIRIAKREPKFVFLGRGDDRTNPLYSGFEGHDPQEAEQYDQPVLTRVGTRDESELVDGFPKTADVLFEYDAVMLDDVEAEFFTSDQMLLLQKFVSQRGGGLLMLGGAESFRQGNYQHTPVGELLPVYLDRLPRGAAGEGYQAVLTREGKLEPWIRLEETEQDEQRRMDSMPAFETFNRIAAFKPGASVLVNAVDERGTLHPALVVQQFGLGRAGALMIGDLWRWGLRRETGEEDAMSRAWRQTVRWLVADVPRRIELDVRRAPGSPATVVTLHTRVRDPEFKPLDNATVELTVTAPDAKTYQLRAEPSDDEAGVYAATFAPRETGAYRAEAVVSAPDGSVVGATQTGWTAEPAADEFRRLAPDVALLGRIANETGGQLVAADDLAEFVADLPNRKVPVTEPWVYPLWHQAWVFMLAVACLAGEWGLRRMKGLP